MTKLWLVAVLVVVCLGAAHAKHVEYDSPEIVDADEHHALPSLGVCIILFHVGTLLAVSVLGCLCMESEERRRF